MQIRSFVPGAVTLAVTQHDPDGRLTEQVRRVLPTLQRHFAQIVVQATYASPPEALDLLRAAGAQVYQEHTDEFNGLDRLGGTRRAAIDLALRTGAATILFCDFDRALHWAEYHPDELATLAAQLTASDFTVLGRTARAFASHPRVQRDTESIINHVFARVSGYFWDVTAAARGLSRRAAAALLAGCPDQSIGTDVAWPLFLLRAGSFTLAYRETEGLEFETADRFADQITAAGGRAAWIDQIDASPAQWALRLELARIEVAAIEPYIPLA